MTGLLKHILPRIERLESLIKKFRAAALIPTQSDRQIFADIRDSGILFPGPTLNPNDIGPAINAAFAAGYEGVYICERFAFDGGFAWKCITPVNVARVNGRNISIFGALSGGTYIQLVAGQVTPFTIAAAVDGDAYYEDINGIGDVSGGGNLTDCPNFLTIAAARQGFIIRCNCFGIACNASNYGVHKSLADQTIVRDQCYYGCDYRGADVHGAVTSITGWEDGVKIENVRYFTGGVLNGVNYGKSSATQSWLWLGGQGEGGANRTGTYVAATLINCWFAGSQSTALKLLPEGPAAGHGQFVQEHVIIQGCGFTTAPMPFAIDADFSLNVHVFDSDFYGSPGTYAMRIADFDNLYWGPTTTTGNGTKRIQFGVNAGNVTLDNPGTDLRLDDSIASPAHGVWKHNGFETTIYPKLQTQIPGVMALYDAGGLYLAGDNSVTLVGAKVSAWNDTGPVGDPNRNATQAVDANRPIYNAKDPAYGNQGTLSLDRGGPTFLQTLGWAGAGPPDNGYLLIVGNFDNTANVEIMICDRAGGTWELYQNGANDLHFNGGADIGLAGSTPRLDLPHVWSVTTSAAGGFARIRQDSAVTAVSPGNQGVFNPATVQVTGAAGATGLTIGANFGGAAGVTGKIAFAVIVDHQPTLPELEFIAQYAASRYEQRLAA